jgi:hypothetical protein
MKPEAPVMRTIPFIRVHTPLDASVQSINFPIFRHLTRKCSLSHDQYFMKASPLILSLLTKPQKRLS